MMSPDLYSMKTFPETIDELLEFDRIRTMLTNHCMGESGKKAIQKLPFLTDSAEIRYQLDLVAEWELLNRLYPDCRVFSYAEIESLRKVLHIEGYVYEVEEFLLVRSVLEFSGRILSVLEKVEEPDKFKGILGECKSLERQDELLSRLSNTFDPDGNILPDASPDLKKLHRYYFSKQREADRKFAELVRELSKSGMLTDNKESLRNGRRVLSVPAEHKRKIKGIIHDESASGKTTFIEPEGVISVNNDLFDAERAIKREEYRILKELSGDIRSVAQLILKNHLVMVFLDTVQAKTRLTKDLKGRIPEVVDHAYLDIKQGYHPLLLYKYSQENRKVVPFNLNLDRENHILVISGPNAGGKSVLLKAVGIIQLMLQFGLPVPVGEGSKLGVFKSIFADLGDQQSLEDDLSTYSSHLTAMRYFLQNAGPDSLILIDEFGSGTDPKIGGALAESILRRLRYLKTFGVITTHFGNLKIYANNASGLINGAMTFDKGELKPTYEFSAGKPGSSFGFEIARKVGIHPAILKYAKNKVGSNIEVVDGMLADLQKEKAELKSKLSSIKEREDELKRISSNFENLHREMEVRRKKLKLEKKQIEHAHQTRLQKELEELVKEARKERNLEKAQQALKTFKEKSREMIIEQESIKEELHQKEFSGKVEWKRGMFARLRSGSEIGRLEALKGKKATLEFPGGLRMEANLRDLVPSRDPIEQRKEISVKTEISYSGSGFNSRLDIRGLRYREAVDLLNDYLEKAILANQDQVRITHGKGEGALKKALLETLKNFPPNIQRIDPTEEDGGEGVSILRFL